VPGLHSYCSTKIFVSRFCEATAEEVRSNGIDVMSWEPNGITTKLNPTTGMMMLKCKPAVSQCFSKIGFESKTEGHWLHELQMVPALLPVARFFVRAFGGFIAGKTRQMFLKQQAENKK